MHLPDGGYRRFLSRPFGVKPSLRELHRAIGGDFGAFGVIEREILKLYGLRATDKLVDVGCGAGRLATALDGWFTGSYLGTDVVRSLLTASRKLVRQSNWCFVKVGGVTIPLPDQSVDMVAIFSVFTHLRHEHSYNYLMEARRVLRSDGRIVFSFLELRNSDHWRHFTQSIADQKQGGKTQPLTMFLSREAIETWAQHLNLTVVDIRDGFDRFVPLPHPVTLESGLVMDDYACLGQATCVLQRG